MTDQTLKEIIKSFAYGATPDQVAGNEGISVEEARQIQTEQKVAIAEREAQLRKAGYIC